MYCYIFINILALWQLDGRGERTRGRLALQGNAKDQRGNAKHNEGNDNDGKKSGEENNGKITHDAMTPGCYGRRRLPLFSRACGRAV